MIRKPGNLLFPAALVLILVTGYMNQTGLAVHHFDQKRVAGPLRLAELLAVLVIIWRLIGQDIFHSTRPGLLETCGRHALPVFVASTVGAFFFSYVCTWADAGRVLYGAGVLANVSLCAAFAVVLEQRRSGKTLRFTAPQRPAVRSGIRVTGM